MSSDETASSELELGTRNRKLLLWACLVLKFLESFAYFTLNNIFTLYLTEEFGFGDASSGAWFGVRGALTTLYASAFGALLVDRLGVVVCLRIAFALSFVGRAAFASAQTGTQALCATWGPMAMGHGLGMPVLTIGIKRASAGESEKGEAWGYGLLYWATVLGILLCGPAIDIAVLTLGPAEPLSVHASNSSRVSDSGVDAALLKSSTSEGLDRRLVPAGDGAAAVEEASFSLRLDGPYRALGLLTAGLSLLGLGISLLLPGKPSAFAQAQLHPLPQEVIEESRTERVAGSAKGHLAACWAVCTKRLIRFALYSVAIVPGTSVLRNLDGGVFPKFMVRTFGARVPKGMVYALNPALDLLFVPVLSARTTSIGHFTMIRVGLLVSALSPLVLPLFGASMLTVVGFVLLLTLGDMLYNPRLDAYAMRVAPDGREGRFAGLAAMVVFLADLPTGVIGGRPPGPVLPWYDCKFNDGDWCWRG